MFHQLTENFQKVFKFIKGEGGLTRSNVEEALRRIRIALLEADVNYRVVKEFVEKVRQKIFEVELLKSLSPFEQVVRIVRDELIELLGKEWVPLKFEQSPPTIFMLVGLQGSGKTTTAGKLAFHFKKKGKKPLLVSLDLKRAAAQQQLEVIAKAVEVDFLKSSEDLKSSIENAVRYCRENSLDPLIVDTAGRLHIDEEMMSELEEVKRLLNPTETILIADAMTGQDAIKIAREFNRRINFDSVILTKLDGDARGGAALSIRAVTGKPIKFVGVGEAYDRLEVFHPKRMASRILGFGDVFSLIERAEEKIRKEEAEKLAEKLARQEFTLEDFRDQLRLLKKLGGLSELFSFLPKVGPFGKLAQLSVDDKKLKHAEAIINSMTPEERRRPEIIDASRKRRIARGSGRPVSEVNKLLKGFFEMRRFVKSKNFRKLVKGIDINQFIR